MRPQARLSPSPPASLPLSPLLGKYLISDLPSARDIQPYLERMDTHRWYTNFGPLVHEFEQKLTSLLAVADPNPQNGSIHVTTMATCYQALEVGLRLLGVPAGGKVLIPAVSFPACPLAVQHAGTEAVFADVDPTNWMLTPEIARRVAQKTRLAAVMPLTLYGIPLPVVAWDEFSRDTGIPVVIDAAAAIESQAVPHKGLVAHSLHATKPFGVGEGGVLAARDPDLIARARVYSNFGMVDRISYGDGTNAKMSEYHAAVGLAQAARWTAAKQKRRALLDLYRRHLEPLAYAVSMHPAIDQAVVSLLMLRFDQSTASDLIASGKAEGIALHHTYLPPLYHHPHFAGIATVDCDGNILPGDTSLQMKAAHMGHSEAMHRHIVGVPFHPFLGEEDVAAVVAAFQRLADL